MAHFGAILLAHFARNPTDKNDWVTILGSTIMIVPISEDILNLVEMKV